MTGLEWGVVAETIAGAKTIVSIGAQAVQKSSAGAHVWLPPNSDGLWALPAAFAVGQARRTANHELYWVNGLHLCGSSLGKPRRRKLDVLGMLGELAGNPGLKPLGER